MALPDSERIAEMELYGIAYLQQSTNFGPMNQKVPLTFNQDILPRTYNINATVVADSGIAVPGAPYTQGLQSFSHMLGIF